MNGSKKISVKTSTLSLLVILVFSLYSCGTYQSVYSSDDGIYGNGIPEMDGITVVDEEEFNKNYFTYELEKMQELNNEDIFTDIDDYYYDDGTYDLAEGGSGYDSPWEYTNDITIQFNDRYPYYDHYGYGGSYFGMHYRPFYSWYSNSWRYRYSPYWDYYDGYPYGYGYGYGYGYYGSNYGYYGYNGYGYSPNYYPYYNTRSYNRFYDNNRRYGRRSSVLTNTRSEVASNSSVTRRSSTVNGNSSSTQTRRSTTNANNAVATTQPGRISSGTNPTLIERASALRSRSSGISRGSSTRSSNINRGSSVRSTNINRGSARVSGINRNSNSGIVRGTSSRYTGSRSSSINRGSSSRSSGVNRSRSSVNRSSSSSNRSSGISRGSSSSSRSSSVRSSSSGGASRSSSVSRGSGSSSSRSSSRSSGTSSRRN